MRVSELHDLCGYVRPGQATARIPVRAGQVSDATLDLVLTVTLHVVCATCEAQSAPIVTVSPAKAVAQARGEGWRTLDGETLCAECYTERVLNRLPEETRSQVVQPSDLNYHRGKGGGARKGVLVTGRVVGRTPQGEEMIEEFISVNGVVQRETIARSYLEQVTMPISAEEAHAENPHLFSMVKDWVRKQIYHAVDAQECAERLAAYRFYQQRTRPEHVRATGIFIRYSDGTGVAEMFYMERRKLRRYCVGQAFVDDHFAPLPFDEALRLDKTLVAHLEQWVRRQGEAQVA